MRFLKRLFRILVVVLILGAIGLGVMFYLSHRTPDGYAPLRLTQAERDAARKRVELQKLPQLLNLASQSQANASAAHRAGERGAPVPAAATQPLAPVTVTFTQDEINASVWKHTEGYKGTYEKYVTGPYFVLEEGSVILMGTVAEFGRVASAYFEPAVDQKGMLRFDLASIKVGSLPLPEAVLAKKRAAIETSLRAQLPKWQQSAAIDATGVVNDNARAAALAKFVLHIFNHEPSPAVIFLSKDITDWKNTFPLRLTKVTVEKGALTITVQPMTADERAALLKEIRQPEQQAVVEVPKG
jgi:hypothetical protein